MKTDRFETLLILSKSSSPSHRALVRPVVASAAATPCRAEGILPTACLFRAPLSAHQKSVAISPAGVTAAQSATRSAGGAIGGAGCSRRGHTETLPGRRAISRGKRSAQSARGQASGAMVDVPRRERRWGTGCVDRTADRDSGRGAAPGGGTPAAHAPLTCSMIQRLASASMSG